MVYHFQPLQARLKEIEKRLEEEYLRTRAGRVHPDIFDSLTVNAYGSSMPLRQVGNIALEDAQTLYISPWDKSHIPDIEKAVRDSNTGASPTSDISGVRITFPALTYERKMALVRHIKEKLELSRIVARKERDDVWTDIQRQAQQGAISEDEKYRLKDELQKMIDATNKKLEDMSREKEKAILGK